MKSGTLTHIKTKRLKLRLKIPLYQAGGILETMWQVTAESADDGVIGRLSNEEIAACLEWERDPDELILALEHCRWLDRNQDGLLVVHDWMDHCPNYIKDRLRKRGNGGSENGHATPPISDTPRKSASDEDEIPESDPQNPEISSQCSTYKPTHLTKETNPPNQPTKESPPRKISYTEADLVLAREMLVGVQDVVPQFKPPNLETWANDIRLMRERDGPDRTLDGIREMFRWANRHEFWRRNILSPSKLREKWDTLTAQKSPNVRNRDNANGTRPGDPGRGRL